MFKTVRTQGCFDPHARSSLLAFLEHLFASEDLLSVLERIT
jgi:hypothetical protein